MTERSAKLSQNCLHGRSVPRLLAELWKEHEDKGESMLINVSEAHLVDSTDGDFFAGYTKADIEDSAMLGAYEKMFAEVAFFAKEADGGLVGFWIGAHDQPDLEGAPIVALTNEGSFQVFGANFADYLVYACDAGAFIDDEEEVSMVDAIRAWLAERGVTQTRSPEEIDEACGAFEPSPDERFNAYWAALRDG